MKKIYCRNCKYSKTESILVNGGMDKIQLSICQNGASKYCGREKPAWRKCAHFKGKDKKEIPSSGIGDLSDGYHTFNELYHHRAVLFSVICNQNKDLAWKAKKHDDGTMYKDMFIVGIETPQGQSTYHYDITPYWDMFDVAEMDNAPVWDGHTAGDAINRLASFGKQKQEEIS